jgi:hypothetical protein
MLTLAALILPTNPILIAQAATLQKNVIVTTTIQAAINAANPGDTVVIPVGTYTESLTLNKAISLTGVSSVTTIINAVSGQRVLTVTGVGIDNTVVISGLTFANGNTFHGGGLFCGSTGCGGGISIDTWTKPRIENVIIVNNHADAIGGGIYANGGHPLILINTQFISNTAGGGGGLVADCGVILTDGYFENNRAASDAGGLYAGSTLTLTNTIFISNTAGRDGGGLYQGRFASTGRIVNALFLHNTADGNGAGLNLNSSGTFDMLHSTIADISVNAGQAIVISNGTVGITNTLIASYTIGISQTGGSIFEDYNLFFNVPITKTASVASGGHSLIGNPKFVDPSSNNYRLGVGSAAIDNGVNVQVSTDIEGITRPQGVGYDIGAFEAISSTLSISTSTTYLPLILKNQAGLQ